MGLDKFLRRKTEKEDEKRVGITEEEKDDYTDERTAYRNEYDDSLEKQVTTDALTGLVNRQGFVNELQKTMQAMRQSFDRRLEKRRTKEHLIQKEHPALEEFSLLFIDLDNFKRVNDTLGHTAGDRALVRVAEILKRSVRKGAVEARFHGDEFAVFLPRINEEEAEIIAGNVLRNLENDSELEKFGVSASIGVRHIGKPDLIESMTPEMLIDEADTQQVKAKQGGKGRVEIHKKQ